MIRLVRVRWEMSPPGGPLLPSRWAVCLVSLQVAPEEGQFSQRRRTQALDLLHAVIFGAPFQKP